MTALVRTARWLLVGHVLTSVGLSGSVAAFLLLSVCGLYGMPAMAVYPALDLLARVAVTPLLVLALVTGVVQSLVTPWGLVRHWWVVLKLGVTLFTGAVLLVQLPGIQTVAAAAMDGPDAMAGLDDLRRSFVLHSGAGLLVLLVPLILSVFKPRGLTAWGQRRT